MYNNYQKAVADVEKPTIKTPQVDFKDSRGVSGAGFGIGLAAQSGIPEDLVETAGDLAEEAAAVFSRTSDPMAQTEPDAVQFMVRRAADREAVRIAF